MESQFSPPSLVICGACKLADDVNEPSDIQAVKPSGLGFEHHKPLPFLDDDIGLKALSIAIVVQSRTR